MCISLSFSNLFRINWSVKFLQVETSPQTISTVSTRESWFTEETWRSMLSQTFLNEVTLTNRMLILWYLAIQRVYSSSGLDCNLAVLENGGGGRRSCGHSCRQPPPTSVRPPVCGLFFFFCGLGSSPSPFLPSVLLPCFPLFSFFSPLSLLESLGLCYSGHL